MNTPIDYSSRYSFGHFCCRVKQGKRLSEFLQKYTDSGTETTHLAGYNILVFEYGKISAALPLLFIGAVTSESGNLLTYMKNIHFSSSMERQMETSRKNTASRCSDNVYVYDK